MVGCASRSIATAADTASQRAVRNTQKNEIALCVDVGAAIRPNGALSSNPHPVRRQQVCVLRRAELPQQDEWLLEIREEQRQSSAREAPPLSGSDTA